MATMGTSGTATPATAEQARLHGLRTRRAELRDSMNALEKALSGPVPASHVRWRETVRRAVGDLSRDVEHHIEITEGPDGLYAELRRSEPRLTDAVARLSAEHAGIDHQMRELVAAVEAPGRGEDEVRDLGTRLLGTLIRHRQRGADLVYEAYEVDIGGNET